ncbi:hypothetical protein BN3087_220059 [Sulfurovum sp. enrichment culture clone C5]|uniref:Uncharacterized protein n=1 Tax=Sulfurovum sp. enrichment culture clone C5 TaxID=497650 RepID=A0A0S4XLP7_9BACT|nr:hypothetical protein BN3087_220059 [Sulfurovum sp. enrichment culture clone C5]
MRYFKKDSEVFGIEKGQEHIIKNDWIEITKDEALKILNPPLDVAKLNQQEIEKAQKYLTDTDFYMTIDKYETLTADKKQELMVSRQKARDVINNL